LGCGPGKKQTAFRPTAEEPLCVTKGDGIKKALSGGPLLGKRKKGGRSREPTEKGWGTVFILGRKAAQNTFDGEISVLKTQEGGGT